MLSGLCEYREPRWALQSSASHNGLKSRETSLAAVSLSGIRVLNNSWTTANINAFSDHRRRRLVKTRQSSAPDLRCLLLRTCLVVAGIKQKSLAVEAAACYTLLLKKLVARESGCDCIAYEELRVEITFISVIKVYHQHSLRLVCYFYFWLIVFNSGTSLL